MIAFSSCIVTCLALSTAAATCCWCWHTHNHTDSDAAIFSQKTGDSQISLQYVSPNLSKKSDLEVNVCLASYWTHIPTKWFIHLRVSQYQKSKTNLHLMEQVTVSGSVIIWAICKSAPRPRQKTMPAPHLSVFYKLDALPATQPTASKHWRKCYWLITFN